MSVGQFPFVFKAANTSVLRQVRARLHFPCFCRPTILKEPPHLLDTMTLWQLTLFRCKLPAAYPVTVTITCIQLKLYHNLIVLHFHGKTRSNKILVGLSVYVILGLFFDSIVCKEWYCVNQQQCKMYFLCKWMTEQHAQQEVISTC